MTWEEGWMAYKDRHPLLEGSITAECAFRAGWEAAHVEAARRVAADMEQRQR